MLTHDIHVHTFLSRCGKPDAIPEDYIKKAKEQGIKVLGFSDHLWDSDVEGATPWYQSQNLEHLLKIKELLPKQIDGIKILIGCETEYCGNGKVAITKEHAKMLDYVLVPVTHFHWKGLVLPSHITSSKDMAKLMVDRFREAVQLGVATGIAHPFVPGGHTDRLEEILSYISNDEFEECFGLAAENDVSVEIQTQMHTRDDNGEYMDVYCRMFEMVKKAGCKVHIGSDAHSMSMFGITDNLRRFVADCQLTEDDILPLVRA